MIIFLKGIIRIAVLEDGNSIHPVFFTNVAGEHFVSHYQKDKLKYYFERVAWLQMR